MSVTIEQQTSAPVTASVETRPSVLVVTSELPWPLNTGGHLRTFHLMKALAQRFDVKLLTSVGQFDDPGIGVLEEHGLTVRVCRKRPGRRAAELSRVASAFAKGEPYVMYHRHNHGRMRDLIQRELQGGQPDIVYLDHLDPLAFRDLFPKARLVADLHNVYSKLADRVADERHWLVSRYLKREARLLATVERRIVTESAAVMAVSSQEQHEFQQLGGGNVHLVPNGVSCETFSHMPIGRSMSPPVLLYLGALSWQPNAKAAEFLARSVMPTVLAEHPNAVLQIVGRNPGLDVTSLGQLPGVEIHPNVPDIGVYLEQASLLAVPLDSGGGTRLKILEGFAAGLPIVSTPIGCEGIDCQHGKHLWVAERSDFAQAILSAIEASDLANEYAQRGRELALSQYDWPVIGERACDAVMSAVR
ncbi:MAG: glycosyltransferase family 4 protein [Planctomycetota bacterium]|jgi:glycosyltransferase involved in cell wall biosynthesis